MRLNLPIWPASVAAALILGGSVATQYDLKRFEHELPPVPALQAPMDSVERADTLSTFPGCKGDCRAGDAPRDSVTWGGDGIMGNADDWELKVWKVTRCPDRDGAGAARDPYADSTIWSVTDSIENTYGAGGYWNIVLIMTDGACQDTAIVKTLNNTYITGITALNDEGMLTWAGDWRLSGNDLVVRDVRGRLMYNQGIALEDGERVVFDRLSVAWSPAAGGQANIKVGSAISGDSVRGITVSRSITFEPRVDQLANMAFGSNNRDSPWQSRMFAVGNVNLGFGHRCPNFRGDTILLAQHVAYNCVNRFSSPGNQLFADFYGYMGWIGASTATGSGRERPIFLSDTCTDPLTVGDSVCSMSIYANNFSFINDVGGDTIWNETNPTNLWRGPDSLIVCRDTGAHTGTATNDPNYTCPVDGDTILITVKVGEAGALRANPFTPSDFGIPSYMWPDTTGFADTTAVIAHLATVGPHVVACDGTITTARDTVDRVMFNHFLNDIRGTTPVGHALGDTLDNVGFDGQVFGASVAALADTVTLRPSDPGGFLLGAPSTSTTRTRCSDNDNDGMPNAWEGANGLDSLTFDADSDADNDGFLALEEYLNGSDPQIFTNAADGSETTYGSTVYIYRAPSTVQDTLCFTAGLAVSCPAADTVIVRSWNGDSIPPGGIGLTCWPSDLSARYFVTESALAGGNLLDSLAADTLVHVIPGCDTVSPGGIKDTAWIPN